MKSYAGIDLHARNNYLGIIDNKDRRLFGKRLSNSMGVIKDALEPFRRDLVGVVVESTYNWYWIVDGLKEAGYRVHLANPLGPLHGCRYRHLCPSTVVTTWVQLPTPSGADSHPPFNFPTSTIVPPFALLITQLNR